MRIILRSEQQVQYAIKFLQDFIIDPNNFEEITFKSYKQNRSLEQNALYWKWMTVCGETLGYSKDGMHQTFMREHLAPLIIDTPSGDVMEYSTKKLSVKEMSTYMENVSFTAGEYGVKLPHE